MLQVLPVTGHLDTDIVFDLEHSAMGATQDNPPPGLRESGLETYSRRSRFVDSASDRHKHQSGI